MTLQEIINEIKNGDRRISLLEWMEKACEERSRFYREGREDLLNERGIMVKTKRRNTMKTIYDSESYLIYIKPDIFTSAKEEIAIMNESGPIGEAIQKMAEKYGTRFLVSDNVLRIQIDTIQRRRWILGKRKKSIEEYLWPKTNGVKEFYGPFKATEKMFYYVSPENIKKLRGLTRNLSPSGLLLQE